MKFLILILLPAAFLTIPGCPNTKHNSVQELINITENDNGKELTLATGQEFVLTLPNHVDGGYKLDKEQYDTSILKLEDHTVKAPPPNSGLGQAGCGNLAFYSD